MDTAKLILELETKEMTEPQKRLIRVITALLAKVATTAEEKEFFENSAELMRTVASLVQQANFNQNTFPDEDIDYAHQAVEFSIDCVQEALQKQKVIIYDN